MKKKIQSTFNTGSSSVVSSCQICNNSKLESIIFLGYLPPVNTLPKIGTQPHEQPSYPAELLYCSKCQLVQLGLVVDPKILFPESYPYTSSTTKVLRENFKELYEECIKKFELDKKDLIIDIGSNDGNLLNNFKKNHRVLGVTPESIGELAIKNGIPTILSYFDKEVVKKIKKEHGKAKIITATNVFAHIENVHEVVRLILDILQSDGVFVSESHYLAPLIEKRQYDTIYHEHLRYYSLRSLQYLLNMHGLEVFHAKEIPPHGGSIRVYAARKGMYPIEESVKRILKREKESVTNKKQFTAFSHDVMLSKLSLHKLLHSIKAKNGKIYGISAPSRASTLINYVGLDDQIVNCVLEVKGSYKTGKYIPGTIIPILDEAKLFKDQPEYALIFSWHIAKELMPKLREKGFKGKFIIPLPKPKIVR